MYGANYFKGRDIRCIPMVACALFNVCHHVVIEAQDLQPIGSQNFIRLCSISNILPYSLQGTHLGIAITP